MISRRPGPRFNRGRIAVVAGSSPPAVTPLTILGSLAWWVRADLGITLGTGVAAWADQSGNSVDFTQATGAAQPTLVAGAINGQPSVRADGVDDVLTAAWARAAPGTQPFYIWHICKQIGWANLKSLLGDFVGAAGFVELQRVASPGLEIYNSATTPGNNVGGVIGSYFRHEMQFQATVADYLKIGSTNVTGTTAANNAGSGTLQLFNRGDSAAGRFANIEIAEAFAFLGTPDAAQRAALDAYCTARYGAGLV